MCFQLATFLHQRSPSLLDPLNSNPHDPPCQTQRGNAVLGLPAQECWGMSTFGGSHETEKQKQTFCLEKGCVLFVVFHYARLLWFSSPFPSLQSFHLSSPEGLRSHLLLSASLPFSTRLSGAPPAFSSSFTLSSPSPTSPSLLCLNILLPVEGGSHWRGATKNSNQPMEACLCCISTSGCF